MSATKPADANASETRSIPTRTVVINEPKEMPSNYSETPGGTMFSTTPGGTRIIYDRSFLMACRNSPLAKSPPKLPKIPGITCEGDVNAKSSPAAKRVDTPEPISEDQFEMDI